MDLPHLPMLEHFHPELSAGAFERHRAQIFAVARADMCATNVDPEDGVMVVLGAIPALAPLRDQLLALAHTPAWCVEQLESLAYAAWHAHLRAKEMPRQNDVAPIREAILAGREKLVVVTQLLATYGVIPRAGALAAVAPRGMREIALETSAAVARLMAVADAMERMTPMRRDEVQRIGELVTAMIAVSGRHPTVAEGGEDVAVTRWKAFTLLERAWDEVRRGVTILRWREGDAEEIAPALRRRRGRRVRGKSAQSAGEGGEGGGGGGSGDPGAAGGSAGSERRSPEPATATATETATTTREASVYSASRSGSAGSEKRSPEPATATETATATREASVYVPTGTDRRYDDSSAVEAEIAEGTHHGSPLVRDPHAHTRQAVGQAVRT
ncbi:MAG: hypothetical protein WCJ30_11570 [Deltaproteobacteria bacterium]